MRRLRLFDPLGGCFASELGYFAPPEVYLGRALHFSRVDGLEAREGAAMGGRWPSKVALGRVLEVGRAQRTS